VENKEDRQCLALYRKYTVSQNLPVLAISIKNYHIPFSIDNLLAADFLNRFYSYLKDKH